MGLRLQPLPNGQRIVDDKGMPTQAFTLAWQQNIEALMAQENLQDGVIQALADAVAAIEAAQAAAEAANAAATDAQTAATTAQDAATTAATAAATANATIAQIEAGTFDLEAVTVGGQRFINSGGTLNPEP